MQQPPNYQPLYPQKKPNPFIAWFKRLSVRGKVLFIVACAALLCTCSGFGSFANSGSKTAQTQAQATTQPTQQKQQQAAPTPTPTRNLTLEERVKATATSVKKDAEVLYFPDQKTVQVTTYIGAQWDNNSARDSVKMDCFRMQKALWTAQPPLGLESVIVFLHGDTIDKYGKEAREQVGGCTLKRPTAEQFVWQNLTWRTAWDAYDFKSLAPFLQK
uniref:Uncharacterized protein n=1 Tax=Thermosporothrix sp. COM3 TaxID=2490863 RepID=A0A455SP10_9CHLR|nr:hypothetical protein KTC_38990 [Thermosporothrix sp. COM3]